MLSFLKVWWPCIVLGSLGAFIGYLLPSVFGAHFLWSLAGICIGGLKGAADGAKLMTVLQEGRD